MAISEARLGAKMSYGKWSALMDVAYSYAKIGLRNMWIQYDFNEHNSVRFGNFIQPYGLMSTTSNSLKATYERPIAGACFTPAYNSASCMALRTNPSGVEQVSTLNQAPCQTQ